MAGDDPILGFDISNEPLWAKVLIIVYSVELSANDLIADESRGGNLRGRSRAIAEELNEDSTEIYRILKLLDESGLLTIPGNLSHAESFGLTEKGFNVYHERELEAKKSERNEKFGRLQARINTVIAGLTFVLALTAGIQVLPEIFQITSLVSRVILGILVMGLILFSYHIVTNPDSFQQNILGENHDEANEDREADSENAPDGVE